MSDSMFLSLITAAAASLFVAVLLGFIRPRPAAPKDAPTEVKRNRIISDLEQDLSSAGINMPVNRYITYSIVLGGLVGAVIELAFRLEIIALVAGLGISLFGLRYFYVGRIATKRRRTQMNHIIVACREIAALIHAGNSPDAALELYSAQATSKGVESLTRESNQVAAAIAAALMMRENKGLDLSEALRESADALGNRHYRGMIEVYIRNERLDKTQVERSLLFYAESVNYTLVLRRSLANVMGLPIAEYKGMGILSPALAIYMVANLQQAADFWLSYVGQLAALGLFAYWIVGYWLQNRPLNERD